MKNLLAGLLSVVIFCSAITALSQPATFDGIIVTLPVVAVEEEYFQVELSIVPDKVPEEFLLVGIQETTKGDPKTNSTFADNILEIPSISVAGEQYWVLLKLLSSDPVIFTLLDYELVEERVASKPTPELLRANFEARLPGLYSQSMIQGDFSQAVGWSGGLNEGRASIVEEVGNRFLRITYTGNRFGPDGGVQFIVPLGDSYDELYLSYRIRFEDGFDFVKGGKIPGLAGGSVPSGCVDVDTGFSARMMWRRRGAAVQYLYTPNKSNSCGDDYSYTQGVNSYLPIMFTPGQWHTVQHRIVMNSVGSRDGILQAWFDGRLVLERTAMEYRLDESFAIDSLFFSTFFGGGDFSWASPFNQIVDFDNFIVSVEPIR